MMSTIVGSELIGAPMITTRTGENQHADDEQALRRCGGSLVSPVGARAQRHLFTV